MLQDLEWTIQNAHLRERAEWIKEFNTQDGHLLVTYEFPPDRIHQRVIAERCHQGIYWAWNLSNDIETYTEWSVEHPWTETHALANAIMAESDPEKAHQLRELLFRTKSNYGNADNFQQIVYYGKGFIRSPNPYVLEVRQVDVSGSEGDRYLDKNGPYIGKVKWIGDLKQVIHFAYHKLVPRG
jgi:hypothetical protein